VTIRRSNLLYKLIRTVSYPCLHSVYRISVEGKENIPGEGPGILLPKHQFWTDIPVVGLAAWRPVSYVAKQELFVYPGVRQFITALGGIPLDRVKPLKTLDSFRHLEKILQEGEFVVIFPEGTYYPHSMGRGKHRLIERILRFQEKKGWQDARPIPFIPMGIGYLEKKARTEVRVRIGRPLFAGRKTDAQEFTQAIVQEIARLSGLQHRTED
jgi:1-acyl-sn-glycerol-3-phosphate acyltransferase